MQECKKCGKCCEKSGPTLHIEDKYLVVQGKIPPSDLVTLRKGEKALDPKTGEKIILENEIIKIKGKNKTWSCIYLDEDSKLCSIYDSRPVECRLLKCWDIKSIVSLMNKNLLTRELVFQKIPALSDLIKEHDQKCSYKEIRDLLNEIENQTNNKALEKLKEIILFDINIREIVSEKQKAASFMLDLIFGRSLITTMEQLRYKVKYSREEGLVISPYIIDNILS
ncbi:MAG: YkgJ family cysteine cluster protein [Desulfobacteraceae bacterium]|nr:YkgJ family cysteine cluster protein [Desulfobacteraceae bacterium]